MLDKTGTLTKGRPTVTAIVATADQTRTEVLRLAASLETASEHPLAHAILQAAKDQNLPLSPPKNFDSPLGLGVTGEVEGQTVMIGNAMLFAKAGLDLKALEGKAAILDEQGATTLFMAVNGRPAGLIAIADPIKASTPDALKALKADGLHLIMITGDNHKTAKAVAEKLGLETFIADVLPQDKAAAIEGLRQKGKVVAMAGDGVNDAPALAAAHIGIAMGGGSDVAIESADITLLHGDLMGIVKARRLSRAVMRNIRQNLVLAFVYNGASIPIAAGALYPLFGWLLSPALGAAAMAASSICVVGNAIRLNRVSL